MPRTLPELSLLIHGSRQLHVLVGEGKEREREEEKESERERKEREG